MALNLLPRGHGRRRAVDKVTELRDENRRLRTQVTNASNAYRILDQHLAEARKRKAEVEKINVKQQADIDDLTAENEQLRDELAALKIRFGPQFAAEANAQRITVPPIVRDTSAIEDQATQPIPVLTLQQAHGIGPVTDPGRIRTKEVK